MITNLTPKQKAAIPEYFNKWAKVGYSTERLDPSKTKQAFEWAYQLAGYQSPEVIIVDSPLAAQKKACQLTGENRAHPNHNYQWYWTGYYGFYDYILNELFPEKKGDFHLLEDALFFIQNSHYFVYFDDKVIVSQRPTEIHVDSENDHRLHNELGPALKYADGYSVYALDGVLITEEMLMKVNSKLDASSILGIENADQRVVCTKYFGVGNMLTELEAKELDSFKWYKLYQVELEGETEKLLELKNPSEPKTHYEFVPPHVESCQQAMAVRCGLELFTNPKLEA
jgi:hypothetical protein